MRRFLVILIVGFVAVCALARAVSPLGFARQEWLPQNVLGHALLVRFGSQTELAGLYGTDEGAQTAAAWLRVIDYIPPADPVLEADLLRGRSSLLAAQGEFAAAYVSIQRVAELPGRFGYWAGHYSRVDWVRAVELSYRAYGDEMAEEVVSAAIIANREDIELFERAGQTGDRASLLSAVVITEQLSPEYRSRPAEFTMAWPDWEGHSRLRLAELLWEDGHYHAADRQLDRLHELGEPSDALTMARIRFFAAQLAAGEPVEEAARAFLSELDTIARVYGQETWVNWLDRDQQIEVARLYSALGDCAQALALSFENIYWMSGSPLENLNPRADYWNFNTFCEFGSHTGREWAGEACRMRDEAWQSAADAIDAGAFPINHPIPRELPPRPQPLSCFVDAG